MCPISLRSGSVYPESGTEYFAWCSSADHRVTPGALASSRARASKSFFSSTLPTKSLGLLGHTKTSVDPLAKLRCSRRAFPNSRTDSSRKASTWSGTFRTDSANSLIQSPKRSITVEPWVARETSLPGLSSSWRIWL